MTGKRLLAIFAFLFTSTVPLFGSDFVRDPGADDTGQQPASLSPLPLPPRGAKVLPSMFPGPPGSNPISPVGRNLGMLIRPAGIIFSGRVISIARAAASSIPNPAATTITFQVDDAIRGTRPHERLMIREWAGLWTRGERYRVGERVVLFLYPPGKLGFTSPVANGIGRFAIDPKERVVLNALQIRTLDQDSIVRGRGIIPYRNFLPAVRRLISDSQP